MARFMVRQPIAPPLDERRIHMILVANLISRRQT